MGFKKFAQLIVDAAQAVFPITITILLVSFLLALDLAIIINFLIGDILLIVGLAFFGLGSSVSTNAMAEEIGIMIVKKRNLGIFISVAFLVGFLITVAEPALWVLADQFKAVVEPLSLVFAISIGIGLMVVIALIRILTQVKLRTLFTITYLSLFVLASVVTMVAPDFIPVAFDSGGVTTGALAAPFVMSLGLGISRTHDESGSKEDSFGLIGLVSVGPIVAVLILGFFVPATAPVMDTSTTFIQYFFIYVSQMALAILPFIVLFFFFQWTSFHFNATQVIKTMIGFLYTYIGIVLFLTGANAGLVNMGYFIGLQLTGLPLDWLIIPLGMVFGYTAIAAEPAVIALNKQIDEVTAGSVSSKLMMLTLGVGTALALGVATLRLLTGLSLWWFLLPGYLLIIVLAFFTPRLFYSIAFDSGGAVSGALTTTFLMPFAQGASIGLGANGLSDAFGLVAMIAMMPIITIELLGIVYQRRTKIQQKALDRVEILHLKGDIS